MLAMGLIVWGPELAEGYDDVYAAMFEPPALDPVVDLLAELARGGPVLEFAAGTGRVALPVPAAGSPSRESSCRPTWPGGYAPSPAPMACRSPSEI
jgi:hypothetical protein